MKRPSKPRWRSKPEPTLRANLRLEEAEQPDRARALIRAMLRAVELEKQKQSKEQRDDGA